jgi:enterochelin esterase family protein
MPSDTSPETRSTGPDVSRTGVIFRLPDPDRRLAGVRLCQEVRVPGDLLDFQYTGDGWQLRLDRPPVDRMEYRLELTYRDGGHEVVLDSGNPVQVGGAFGEKSVVEFPGYAPPGWLVQPAPPGRRLALDVPARSLDAVVHATLWSPTGVPDDAALPLLVAHDGPEYDVLSALTRYLAAGIVAGSLPPLRAALLAPGERDAWYSANAAYARALALAVLPALTRAVPITSKIGMGTSLGALAMLHAHRKHPDTFDALYLQSGSFFHPRYDPHERRFTQYRRVTRFVQGVLSASTAAHPIPVVLTCGSIEENVDNNRLMARALRAQGYAAALHEVRDTHNYTGWRDAFDPHLTELLQRVGRKVS